MVSSLFSLGPCKIFLHFKVYSGNDSTFVELVYYNEQNKKQEEGNLIQSRLLSDMKKEAFKFSHAKEGIV